MLNIYIFQYIITQYEQKDTETERERRSWTFIYSLISLMMPSLLSVYVLILKNCSHNVENWEKKTVSASASLSCAAFFDDCRQKGKKNKKTNKILNTFFSYIT